MIPILKLYLKPSVLSRVLCTDNWGGPFHLKCHTVRLSCILRIRNINTSHRVIGIETSHKIPSLNLVERDFKISIILV